MQYSNDAITREYQEKILDAITHAVSQFFSNKLYYPLHPFKLLIHSLFREESMKGIIKPILNYTMIPKEILTFEITPVVLGSSGFACSKHMAKLLSQKSMEELSIISTHIEELFGKQPNSIKNERVSVQFIESFHSSSFFGRSISQPKYFNVDMYIDTIISGKSFDESLNTFIRRILEESHISEVNPSILSSFLKISTGSSTQEVQISTMKDKRQQILNLIKSAVLNEGEIYLEFFFQLTQTYPIFHPDSQLYADVSSGFIRVKRSYRVTFVDNNQRVRCFSKHPFLSLTFGIFKSLAESDQYLNVYLQHMDRANNKSSNPAEMKESRKSSDSSRIYFMLRDVVSYQIDSIRQALGDGELGNMATEMILLYNSLIQSMKKIPYCIQQLSHLTRDALGHLHALRMLTKNLRDCAATLKKQIETSSVVSKATKNVALKPDELIELEKLFNIYSLLPSSVVQLKTMIIEFFRVHSSSEVQHLSMSVTGMVWDLFDPNKRNVPIIHPDITGVMAPSQVAHTIPYLGKLSLDIRRLQSSLFALELTLGMNTLTGLLKNDLTAYHYLVTHIESDNRSRTSHSNLLEKLFTPTDALFRSYNDMPRCVLDLLGFVYNRNDQPGVENYKDRTKLFEWKPFNVSELLRDQLLGKSRDSKSRFFGQAKSKLQTDQDELFANEQDLILSRDNTLLDFYSVVGLYTPQRFGAIDAVQSVFEEYLMQEVPGFMSIEGAKLRYLVESGLLEALYEAMLQEHRTFPSYEAMVRANPFSNILTRLFTFSTRPSLLCHSLTDEDICRYLFLPVRKNLITEETAQFNVYSTIQLSRLSLPSPPHERYASVLREAGLYGLDRVLSLLGPFYYKIYEKMWNIPPLFPTHPAHRMGFHISIECGVSLDTALRWCRLPLHWVRRKKSAQDMRRNEEGRQPEAEKSDEKDPRDKHMNRRLMDKWRSLDRVKEKERLEMLATSGAQSKHNKHGEIQAQARSRDHAQIQDEDDDDGHNPFHYLLQSSSAYSSVHNSQLNLQGPEYTDPLMGHLDCPEEVQLEVVIRINYDNEHEVQTTKQIFATEVSSVCKYMIEHEHWNLDQVSIPHAYDPLKPDIQMSYEQLVGHFFDQSGESGMQKRSLEAALARHCMCYVHASMKFPENDSELKLDQLYQILYSSIYSHSNSPPPHSPAKAAKKTSESLASQTPKEPDFIVSGAPSPKRRHPAFAIHNSDQPNAATLAVAEGLETIDNENKLNPTRQDKDRVCADSILSQDIQRFFSSNRTQILNPSHDPSRGPISSSAPPATSGVPLPSHETIKVRRTFVYVPCKIRFVLLAKHSPKFMWGKNQFRFQNQRYSSVLGHQLTPYSVGKDAVVAQLINSTLWIAPSSFQAQVAQVSDEGLAQSIFHEASRVKKEAMDLLSRGDLFNTLRRCATFSCLSQSYHLSADLTRCYNSVVFCLHKFRKYLHICRRLVATFEVSNSQLGSGFDLEIWGHTITRYVFFLFRYISFAPEFIHHRGAASFILIKLAEIENILNLAPMSMDTAMGSFPAELRFSDSTQPNGFVSYNTESPSEGHDSEAHQREADSYSAKILSTHMILKGKEDATFEDGLQRRANPSHRSPQNIPPSDPANPQVPRDPSPPPRRVRRSLSSSSSSSSRRRSSAFLRNITFNRQPKSQNILRHEKGRDLIRTLSEAGKVGVILRLMDQIEELTDSILYAESKDLLNAFPRLVATIQQPEVEMLPSRDVIDLVLNDHADIRATLAFIHRADYRYNKLLESQTFLKHIDSMDKMKKFQNISSLVTALESTEKFKSMLKKHEESHQISDHHHEKRAIINEIKDAFISHKKEHNSKFKDAVEKLIMQRDKEGEEQMTSGTGQDLNEQAPKMSSLSLDQGESSQKSIVESNSTIQTLSSLPSTNNTDSSVTFNSNPSQASVKNYQPKIILSKFHDENKYKSMLSTKNEDTYIDPIYSNFSFTGFKAIGDSVKEASQAGSMLSMLRSYGGANGPSANKDVPPRTFLYNRNRSLNFSNRPHLGLMPPPIEEKRAFAKSEASYQASQPSLLDRGSPSRNIDSEAFDEVARNVEDQVYLFDEGIHLVDNNRINEKPDLAPNASRDKNLSSIPSLTSKSSSSTEAQEPTPSLNHKSSGNGSLSQIREALQTPYSIY